MPVAVWIKAARLRTLPLAIAGAITGNLMALAETGHSDKTTFLLSVLTAVFLQILSNYANDYGDFKNGADTNERKDRMMASGLISEKKMKNAIRFLIAIVLFLGISLLSHSLTAFSFQFNVLFILGIAGILAAYFYTAGNRPYGYIGLGDLAVFIFFGILAVVGTYYLQTRTLHTYAWWVAAAVGLFSVGVLNVNNIRDIKTDAQKNKNTIPVLLGYKKAIFYQALLLVNAVAFLVNYTYLNYHHPLQLAFLILSPLLIKHFYNLRKAKNHGRPAYNQQLKYLSLLTLVICLLFCFSQLFTA